LAPNCMVMLAVEIKKNVLLEEKWELHRKSGGAL
jgi:hypothetical protein